MAGIERIGERKILTSKIRRDFNLNLAISYGKWDPQIAGIPEIGFVPGIGHEDKFARLVRVRQNERALGTKRSFGAFSAARITF
jgi:hypothetical protein